MSPREVAGLQALAMAQGGSLTINPKTGLPEAGFLDQMLPMLLGVGVMAMSGGTAAAAAPGLFGMGMPATVGLGVGALQTARTGSLAKGLMAGLGAYGGAGLAGGLMGAGAAGATGGADLYADLAGANAGAGAGAGAAPSITATGGADLYADLAKTGGTSSMAGVTGGAPSMSGTAVPLGGTEQELAAAYFPNQPAVPPIQETPTIPSASAHEPSLETSDYSNMNPALDAPGARMGETRPYVPGIEEAPDTLLALNSQQAAVPTVDMPQTADAAPNAVPNAAPNTAPSPGDNLSQMGRGVKALGTEQGRNAFLSGTGGGKEAFKYAYSAGLPLLVKSPNKNNVPTGGPNPYRYRYNPGRVDNPDEFYTGGRSGERRYFNPRYEQYAGGGPVEAMSNANAVGANTGYPMANMQRNAYAVPYQQPVSQNVISGPQDANIDQYTGEERLAAGGISHLGDYSDGGRLLRGPGDGVSDSIPAMIGNKQPARLADGEFVVPARIVSELGNGSTDAGARKLYAMMDRIQRARGKTTGKNRVASNTRAEKYLPA
jgi:hypothetical protein